MFPYCVNEISEFDVQHWPCETEILMNSPCWRKSLKTTPQVCLKCRRVDGDCRDFLVADLQMFYFCRRSLSRDFMWIEVDD